MTTKDTGGSVFKVGDRVEVVDACDDFYSVGSTGVVTRADSLGYWVEFDAPGVKQNQITGERIWFALPFRLAARKEES